AQRLFAGRVGVAIAAGQHKFAVLADGKRAGANRALGHEAQHRVVEALELGDGGAANWQRFARHARGRQPTNDAASERTPRHSLASSFGADRYITPDENELLEACADADADAVTEIEKDRCSDWDCD